MKIHILLLTLLLPLTSLASRNIDKIVSQYLGLDKDEKFGFYRPPYAVFGLDDLKIELSFKYRMARNFPLFFAYSQLMFWDIYDESKPFDEVNYLPEFFYRFLEDEAHFFKGVDMGYLHTSNGKSGDDSRSLNRIFLRGNFHKKISRMHLMMSAMVYEIYDEDETNADITKYLGYYQVNFYLADLIRFQTSTMDVEGRLFSGSKIFNFDEGGGYQLGITYNFNSDKFNPSLYFQRYQGYAESLKNYNKQRTEHRIGLLFNF
jgi:phospholipase A1